HLFERYERHTLCSRLFFICVWVAGDDVFDVESLHAAGNFSCDCAKGKQTDCTLLESLNRPPGLPVPVAGSRSPVIVWEFSKQSHQKRDSVIGDFIHAPVVWNVGYHNVATGRFVNIHDIHTYSVTRDDFAAFETVDRALPDLRILSQH